MPAFIHGELEQKILILYVFARLADAIPFETALDLCLFDDGMQYFDFTERLHELVDSGHLTLSEDRLYAITDKGRRDAEICAGDLPYTVRARCDRTTSACNRALRRQEQVRSWVSTRPNGTFTVHMLLDDDIGNLMDLRVVAPERQLADTLSRRFRENPERIYSRLMDVLLQEEQEASEASQPPGTP